MEIPSVVVIKKYGNRRLYDTSASRYVNLEEIAAMIRQGQDVRVVDALSGEDLTRATLTQVIVDDAREKPSALPLELLKQLIVAGDHAGQEFISWYLKSAFDAYHKVQGAIQGGLSEVAALSPLTMVKSMMQTAAPAAPSQESAEMERLRQRLAELEARMAGQPPKGETAANASKKSPSRPAAGAKPKKKSKPKAGSRTSAARKPRD